MSNRSPNEQDPRQYHRDQSAGAVANLGAGCVLFAASAIPLIIGGIALVRLFIEPSVGAGVTAAVGIGLGAIFMMGGICAVTGWRVFGRRRRPE